MLELPKVLSMLSQFCQIDATKTKVCTLFPFREITEVEHELDRVNDVLKTGLKADFFIPFNPGVLTNDCAKCLYLSSDYFIKLRKWFSFNESQVKTFSKSPLKDYFASFHEYGEIAKAVDRIVDENGDIKDSASAELQKNRNDQKYIKNKINRELQDMLAERTHLFSDSMIVERNGHYVLPVKVNFKKDLKGIIHSYSNSGETVFIEPLEITDDAALLADLEVREKEEIERILSLLTDQLRPQVSNIEEDIEKTIDLDMLFAKAALAREMAASRPHFGSTLNIINGVHPLLQQVEKNVIPLTIRFEPHVKVLVISGPNAGGKTIVLKTVGTLVLMAKCGLFIPVAEGSTIPFFNEVYADIGDEQSIESQLSTFAGHIKQIKEALDAEKKSLVLLDELMSQTSVEEGSALAQAVLIELAAREGLVIATTHNESLKIFVDQQQNMANAGMEYTDRPTYRLIPGIPQPSNAIKLAQKLGINHGIIERAHGFLDKEKVSLNELFEKLSFELKETQSEKERLITLTAEYEKKLNEFHVKKKRELDELKEKYKRELIQSKRSIEKMIKDLKKEGVRSEKVKEIRTYFEDRMHDEKAPPYFPAVGEIVRIRALRKTGQVIEVHGSKYKISLENIYYWVDPEEIEKTGEQAAND